jgi:hypothetical protein
MLITAHKLFFTNYILSLPNHIAEKVECSFFDYLQLKNGTFKTTNSNRLNDLNNETTEYFKRQSSPPKKFMDIAVSSGISTYEWYIHLINSGFKNIDMFGTDLTIYAYLVEINKYFKVLVDNSNYPLQYDFFGLAIKNCKFGKCDWVNGIYMMSKLMGSIYARLSKKYLIEELLSTYVNNGSNKNKLNNIRIRKIKLVSQRMNEKDKLVFLTDNLALVNPPNFKHKFDVIRAANILNLCYFSNETLIIFLTHLKERLNSIGSFMMVCRTNEIGENNGTLFRLSNDYKFEVILRIGAGSEIEHIVLSLP